MSSTLQFLGKQPTIMTIPRGKRAVFWPTKQRPMHTTPRFLYMLLWLVQLGSAIMLTACRPPASANPAAALPTLQPTAVSLITTTVALSHTVTLTGTVPAITATIRPQATVPPLPTATQVTPALTLADPRANADLITGGDLAVSGQVTAQADWRLELALLALDGRLLTAVPIPLTDSGSATWQAMLLLPSQITGQATLQVSLFDNTGSLLTQARQMVVLLPDPNDSRILQLLRPQAIDTAVPGYYLYFDGTTKAPSQNLIRLALLDETCQTVRREDSFRVSGSGYWQGFLPIPDDTPAGPACIRAAFGTPGSENRRETLLPITLLAPTSPEANRIIMLTPLPADGAVQGGDEIALYGLAYNAPDELVYINLVLADGTVLLSEAIETNQYGYWEQSLRVPVGVSGQAQLVLFTATAVQTLAEETRILRISSD
jgi:hypothetical protein